MRPSTWLVFSLPLAVFGCGSPQPAPATPTAALTPAPSSAATAPDLAAARANALACDAKRGKRWKSSTLKYAGAFVFVAWNDYGEARPASHGCVATAAGAIEADYSAVFAVDRDVDGDGRADAVLTKKADAPGDDEGLEPVVIADRPGGPILLAIEGYDRGGAWEAIDWVDHEPATIELRIDAKKAADRQRLAWNGKAIVSRDDTWLRTSCREMPHGSGSHCELVGAAHGRAYRHELGAPVTLYPSPPSLDFAGDGSRFETVAWFSTPWPDDPPGAPEMPDLQTMTVHLGSHGWEETNMPDGVLSRVDDRDGDGRLEVGADGDRIQLSECPRNRHGCAPLESSGDGLMMWDGTAFSGATPRLLGAYAKAKVVVTDGVCPNELLGPAGLTYLKARWTGTSESDALDRAGEVMARGSARACKNVGTLRPFAAYRGELAHSLNDFLPVSTPKAANPNPKKPKAPVAKR